MLRGMTVVLAWLALTIFPFGEGRAGEVALDGTQPGEPAIDISVHVRPALPPEEAPEAAVLGPSLFYKLKDFVFSWTKGEVRKWVAEDPPRVTAVSSPTSDAGQTPRYTLVVLWSFGAGG